MTNQHTHDFVETYDGLVGFGLDRATDEATVKYYLQKVSDDALLAQLIPKLTNAELSQVFEMISSLLRAHLAEPEYHRLFLKESS